MRTAAELGYGKLSALISGEKKDKLVKLIDENAGQNPLAAEAYFLDFSAVDPKRGLLIEAGLTNDREMGFSFGVDAPFDGLAMTWMLADYFGAQTRHSLGDLVEWNRVFKEHVATTNQLGELHKQAAGRGWVRPLKYNVFNLWLAFNKERYQQELITLDNNDPEKVRSENLLGELDDVPSVDSVVEDLVKVESDKKPFSIWDYYGDDFEPHLKAAFTKIQSSGR